jgi:acetylglutamate kinase
MQTIVVKYGGAAMEDLALCAKVAREIAALKSADVRLIVVHGGGKEISSQLTKAGIESKFVNGLRFTDEATLDVVEMLLSGTINKRIVSMIQKNGVDAVGISGRDSKLAIVTRVPDIGFVGEIESVSIKLVDTLLKNDFIPVISPISEEENGQAVNVNADEMARAIAEAVKADILVYLSDVDGLLIGGKVVPKLNGSQVNELLQSPEVTGGMIPKLRSSLSAVENGVGRVIFLNGTKPELIAALLASDFGEGTSISN